MLDYRPLVFFWVAEYDNDKALPQFNPRTGKENKFSLVTKNQLVAFGWYPFTIELAQKIHQRNGQIVIPLPNRFYRITLKKGDTLIAKRNTTVTIFKFHQCGKCGFVWQLLKGKPSPKIGLPRSVDVFVEEIPVQDSKGKRIVRYLSPICPNCGYHDCNAIMIKDKKVKQFGGEKRETVYVLGKMGEKILEIQEDGTVK